MRWTICECGSDDYHRSHRGLWMRLLFPNRRLYRCAKCRQQVFLPAGVVEPHADALAVDPVSPEANQRQRRRRSLARQAAIALPVLAVAAIGLAWWADNSDTVSGGQSDHARAVPVDGCHRVHVFKDGETLESIAASELGAEWRWVEIDTLNRDLMDRVMLQDKGLQPGMQLQLPGGCHNG